MDKATLFNLRWFESVYGKIASLKDVLQYNAVMRRQLINYAVNKVYPRRDNLCVLDIGFGSGANLFLFPRTAMLYGVEISRSAVDFVSAKAKHKGYYAVDLQISNDASRLNYDTNMFDLVICCHVIEHIEDDVKMLTEINRVLRPTGAAVLQIPIDLFDNSVLSDSTLFNPAFDSGESYHVRRYNTLSFQARLERAGFHISDELSSGKTMDLLMAIDCNFRKYIRQIHGARIADLCLSGFLNVPLALLPFHVKILLDSLLGKFRLQNRYGQWIVKKQV